jgi:hypothetical protein
LADERQDFVWMIIVSDFDVEEKRKMEREGWEEKMMKKLMVLPLQSQQEKGSMNLTFSRPWKRKK